MNQNVVTYPVIIQVPNPDLDLKPTMTANVVIDVATAQGVLRVPNAAMRWRPESTTASAETKAAARPAGETAEKGEKGQKGGQAGGRSFGGGAPGGGAPGAGGQGGGRGRRGQTIYTIGAAGLGEPKPVEVRPGITDGRFTQIAEGPLKEGDLVIAGLATAKADVPGAAKGPAGAAPGRRGF